MPFEGEPPRKKKRRVVSNLPPGLEDLKAGEYDRLIIGEGQVTAPTGVYPAGLHQVIIGFRINVNGKFVEKEVSDFKLLSDHWKAIAKIFGLRYSSRMAVIPIRIGLAQLVRSQDTAPVQMVNVRADSLEEMSKVTAEQTEEVSKVTAEKTAQMSKGTAEKTEQMSNVTAEKTRSEMGQLLEILKGTNKKIESLTKVLGSFFELQSEEFKVRLEDSKMRTEESKVRTRESLVKQLQILGDLAKDPTNEDFANEIRAKRSEILKELCGTEN